MCVCKAYLRIVLTPALEQGKKGKHALKFVIVNEQNHHAIKKIITCLFLSSEHLFAYGLSWRLIVYTGSVCVCVCVRDRERDWHSPHKHYT